MKYNECGPNPVYIHVITGCLGDKLLAWMSVKSQCYSFSGSKKPGIYTGILHWRIIVTDKEKLITGIFEVALMAK